MNKYEEAFSRVKEYLIYTGRNNDISFDEIRDLQELVNKTIPKKPVYEDLDCYLACPNCWNNIDDLSSVFTDELIQPKYCPRCGQHIDWSKDE